MAKICYLFGKTVLARERLLLKMMGESSCRGFLHIVPTKGRVMELETDPEFWIRREVNTLTGFIHRVFEEDIRADKYADHFAIDQMVSENAHHEGFAGEGRRFTGPQLFQHPFHRGSE
jgi:hypothetical protein